jgi:ketosteroid isomerase-like protein
MPSRERAEAFVAAVVAGNFVQSIRDFYAEDATAQENLQPPRVGREALIAHEEKTLRSMGKVEPHATTLLVDGDRVVIGWRFDTTSSHCRPGAATASPPSASSTTRLLYCRSRRHPPETKNFVSTASRSPDRTVAARVGAATKG